MTSSVARICVVWIRLFIVTFIIIIYIVILLPYPHLLHGLRQVRPLTEDLHLEQFPEHQASQVWAVDRADRKWLSQTLKLQLEKAKAEEMLGP